MNIVQQIFDAVTDTAQEALGSDYTKLKRVYDIASNDLRSVNKAFGVTHGGANSASGVTRVYTMDQLFRVSIVHRIVDRDRDDQIQDTINAMYDKADELLVRTFLTKLGLSAVVLIVDQPSIQEPILLENGSCVLVVEFNVKYRQAIQ